MYPLAVEDNTLVVGTRANQRPSSLSVSSQHCPTHGNPVKDRECKITPVHLSFLFSFSSSPPLPSPPPPSPLTSQCPFIRSVYILSAETGHAVLGQLLQAVARVNSATLCLDDLPQDIRPAALSTYKLTR